MILPSLIPIAGVLIVGFALGAEALGGLLIGSIISGAFVAISMTSEARHGDNAKKYIESGNLGGKGSEAHKAPEIRRHGRRPVQRHRRPGD